MERGPPILTEPYAHLPATAFNGAARVFSRVPVLRRGLGWDTEFYDQDTFFQSEGWIPEASLPQPRGD